MMMSKMKLSVRDLCLISIFTAIIAVMSQLSIPMPYGVPMTMQTFAIPLAGIVLGAKKGTISTIVYILLGAIGAPVFSAFSGGIGIVFGLTGGFILSFPFMAFAAGIGCGKDNNIVWLSSGLVAGAAINFICGMFWFSIAAPSDLNTAFAACVLPFIPTTILKIATLVALGGQLKKALVKSKVLA